MPRYKEYNVNRVLLNAMYQFWHSGYGATSVSNLCRKMRINKFTFYEAFESKENLLLLTIKFYIERFQTQWLEQLKNDKDIISYFRKMLEPCDHDFHGCYMLKITAEIGESIPEVVKMLEEYLAEVRSILNEIIHYYHPELDMLEHMQKVEQLLALFTSIPLVRSIKPTDSCIEYAETVLNFINLPRRVSNA